MAICQGATVHLRSYLPYANAAAILLVACGCVSNPRPQQNRSAETLEEEHVPEALRPYVDRMSAPLTPMELPDYVKGDLPASITRQEALEDVEILRYILDNAYSGRYYWQRHGVDFPGGYDSLRRYVMQSASSEIDTREFEQRIQSAFEGINDPHTAIIGHETNEFFTRIRQYFASFVIAKQDGRYVVVQSADSNVPVGAEYVDSGDKLFPTLSPAGSQHYLFGRMDTVPFEKMKVRLAQGEVSVAMHPCRIGNIQYDRFDNIIEKTSVRGVPVVRSSSFWVEGKIKELESFSEYGKQLRDQPYFIWNLLSNDGGITQYPAAFIENFNGLQQDESWEVHLHSTPIAQAYLPGKNAWSSWPAAWLDDATPLSDIPEYKRAHVMQVRQEKLELVANPRRYWAVVRAKPERRLGDYKGKAVILSNYRNGSAGNNALAMSKSIPNSVIVGENSNMTYAFANTRNFSLKHSRIKLRLPGRLIINPANSVERGFLPDFWLDSEAPVEEVVEWLHHRESYQFRYLD